MKLKNEYLDMLEDVGIDGGLIRTQKLGAEEGEEEVGHDGEAGHLCVSEKMFPLIILLIVNIT